MANSSVLDRRGRKKNVGFCGPFEAHAAGGRASGRKLTPQQRSDKARMAVKVRWARSMEKWEAEKRERDQGLRDVA